MFSSAETNYRTEGAGSGAGGGPQGATTNSSTNGGQSSTNSHMSVAAKAGEMQIFSADILSQVNGIQRRQTTKALVRQGGKYSTSSNNMTTNMNDTRLNHIQEQINNVEEKMLQIDAAGIKPSMSQQDRSSAHHMLSTLQNSSNDRMQPLTAQSMTSGLPPRDSLSNKPKLQTIQNHQRLHPTQTFGEYVASNSTGPVQAKSRMTANQNFPSTSGGSLNPILMVSNQQAQKYMTQEGHGMMPSNGHISNSQSNIGVAKPVSSYSCKAETNIQNSPMIGHQISDNNLQIDVQASQNQFIRGPDITANGLVVDQNFTPTMVRRSVGSHSAVKQQERLSFLDKTAQQSKNEMTAASASFDIKNSLNQVTNMPAANLPVTATAKKIALVKEQQAVASQQLFQSRYTNGNEPNMLPKMAGISLERKQANQSKQKNSSLPPTGSLSLIQQNHLRRRHGEGSYGGPMGSRMDFGIAGESLQIKLTGTSLMNRNQQRDSYSQQMAKEGADNSSISLQASSIAGPNQLQPLVYHPKMRQRGLINGPPSDLAPQFTSVISGPGSQNINQASAFAQHMAEMQMNSPKNSSQIFQENLNHGRVYSYHYIYDYLFVQVTEEQYAREYAKRIKTYTAYTSSEDEEGGATPTRATIQGEPASPLNGLQVVDPQAADSPRHRLRGPALKLNQNKVFFSPNSKDAQNSIEGDHNNQGSNSGVPAYRKTETENMNKSNLIDYATTSNGQNAPHNAVTSIESNDNYVSAPATIARTHNNKVVVKMKKPYMRTALDKALQSTQFEGLKILTRETILKAYKPTKIINNDISTATGANSAVNGERNSVDENQQFVPKLKLQNVNDASAATTEVAVSSAQKKIDDDDNVSKFMMDLGSYLQDMNQRFKVTVKKKYINDILMQSKGAQNLAQNVVMVVTNNAQLQMNSPIKKVKRAKRNLSIDASSGEEENTNEGTTSHMRNHGQATPQVTSSKAKAQQIGRRGYESENEAKSLNSTTTSSTFPNLKTGGYATKQQNTPRQPRKMSTRSLSQIPNTVRVQRKITDDINGDGAASRAVNPLEDQLNQLNVRYAPTKIRIIQNVNRYNDHMDHPINKMLSDYNEFTRLVFRTRVTEARAVQNIPYAIKLGKRLGMQLTKNQLMPATLKVRENANAIKEKLIFYMCKIMQQENEFQSSANQTFSLFKKQVSEHTVQHVETLKRDLEVYEQSKQQAFHYRCYVGKGNNQMMVRALFKNRFWWLFHEKEEPEKVNFFWTQLRKLSIMNSLNCKFVNPKDKKQQAPLKASNLIDQQIPQASNNMMTPGGSNKFKKRKVSSAQSKSPEQTISAKQNTALAAAIALDSSSVKAQAAAKDAAMNLIGLSRASDLNLAATEESKVEIAAVTCAPPQAVQQSPTPNKEEIKKETPSGLTNITKAKTFETYPVKLANKIEDNYHLCNKKALFVNMKNYYEVIGEDPFDSLPVTFHIKEGLTDPNFLAFQQYYEEHRDEKNIWITKPGECTNRGVGIQVAKEWGELVSIITENTRSSKRTCIVQKYIHDPLLIHRRKFDIRTYAMATSYNGNYKAYYYTEGYLRTSCREFSLSNLSNRMVHLTNDAVQKKAEDYGKFEPGNKLSYTEFQSYIDKYHGSMNVCFERDILPQIKKLTTDCFRASYGKMDPYKRFNTFECFGLDFMIDEQFKVYLIEVNTNPCLELSSPLLARLIPSMVENSLRLAVDPIFPPPEHFSQRKHVVNELCPENKFELIFDERIDGPELVELYREKDNVIIEIDEEELSDADIDGKEPTE